MLSNSAVAVMARLRRSCMRVPLYAKCGDQGLGLCRVYACTHFEVNRQSPSCPRKCHTPSSKEPRRKDP